ncbi:ATP-dependent nuclease [Haloferax volcanii]|uniref:ATP-dependent nuclease n=1 Tax=Haloferax volcanii TaxID=2246 RepID=UPI003852073E
MRIDSVRVKNYRSLRDAEINFNELTALIGSNGAGKSSFLRALDLFYTANASYSEEDFYNRNTQDEISVQVKFTDLGRDAKEKFSSYVGRDTLTVEKVMEYPDNRGNQRYHGNRLYNPEFDGFRKASGHGLRQEYEDLLERGYSDFPDYQNQDEAETVLREWEEANPDQCERRRDDGQFFGFNTVGQAALEEFTRYILIPAVRDASEDADDKRGSPLTELMDLVVRAALSEREELEEFQQAAQQAYARLIDEASEDELGQLETDLSTTLETFAPGVGVNLSWDTENVIDVQMPQADIKLEVDDFVSNVEHAGHGSQRAFIISLLQNLAIHSEEASSSGEDSDRNPSLILGIEEPELYQHPNRQRHLMSILTSFDDQEITGTASSVQVVYSTHSPLMVNMKRFDDIRSLSKVGATDGRPKYTEVKQSSLDEISRRLEHIHEADEGSFSDESTRARLEPVMTPWVNEGFFSDAVILVEGLEDRSALLGRANARGIDLSSLGIAILPCNGKTKISRPAIIFERLGKPVYVMFDGDHDDRSEVAVNRRLLRLLDVEEEDWPSGVYTNHACFRKNLTECIRTGMGAEFYDDTLQNACDDFGYYSTSRGAKNSAVMSSVFKTAEEDNRSVSQVDKILDRVIKLV